jgi:hypothetical protein
VCECVVPLYEHKDKKEEGEGEKEKEKKKKKEEKIEKEWLFVVNYIGVFVVVMRVIRLW